MKDYKTLFNGEYLKIISPLNVPWEIVHQSDGIFVMPIIVTHKGIYTAIRKEYCPPYIMKTPEFTHYYTVVAGGIEKGENPESAMIRELREETGIDTTSYKILLSKNEMPFMKSTSSRLYPYIIHITAFNAIKPKGDGTIGEKLSTSKIVNVSKLGEIVEKPNCDYLLYSMYYIFMNTLRKNFRI